jgi:nitrite reductase/ring-hydroxylating ferredoxin subunit
VDFSGQSGSLEADADGFLETVAAETVRPERITAVTVAGVPLILTRVDGRIHAVSAHCPHAAGDLRRGHLRRGQLSCPEHGFRFDVGSGRAVWPPDEVCRLKRYVVKEEDGMVKVRL